jgi:hypothetical protein
MKLIGLILECRMLKRKHNEEISHLVKQNIVVYPEEAK